jgi:hypothetical protein
MLDISVEGGRGVMIGICSISDCAEQALHNLP